MAKKDAQHDKVPVAGSERVAKAGAQRVGDADPAARRWR